MFESKKDFRSCCESAMGMNMNAINQSLHIEETLTTTELGKVLGFHCSIELLKNVGVSPMVTTVQGTYWRASDVSLICRAIQKHLDVVAKSSIDLARVN